MNKWHEQYRHAGPVSHRVADTAEHRPRQVTLSLTADHHQGMGVALGALKHFLLASVQMTSSDACDRSVATRILLNMAGSLG